MKFTDGYNAELGDLQLNHIFVKHDHQWEIDDIDLKNTRDVNKNLDPI